MSTTITKTVQTVTSVSPVRKARLRNEYPCETFLSCSRCHEEYSATREDYFMISDEEVLMCGECERPLAFVQVAEYKGKEGGK